MQVRFTCPACKQTHITDTPETTLYMTCSRTHKALQLRLTAGGDVKSAVVGQEVKDTGGGSEEEEA
jgi:hypothetical protein